jgi:hypothetical protein
MMEIISVGTPNFVSYTPRDDREVRIQAYKEIQEKMKKEAPKAEEITEDPQDCK